VLGRPRAGPARAERPEGGRARPPAAAAAGSAGGRGRIGGGRPALRGAGAGAAAPPGSTWRDRPAVDRGDGIWLAGDRAAAPGILSEVACASAIAAARGVLEKVLGA